MNLHYQQKGEGEFTLFLIHGNSSSSNSYIHQLNSDLSKKNIIHAVDLPGHGLSLPATNTDVYSIPGYADSLLDHIQQKDLKNVILVGWSLGGHIALEMLAKSKDIKGLVIFGTPPLGIPPAMDKAFLPNEAVNVGFVADVEEAMALVYAKSFFKKDADIDLTPFATDILKTDGAARGNLVPSMSTIGYTDEVEILEKTPVPVMIIHGQEEQLVNGAYIETLSIPKLWNGKIQYIADAGHAPQIEMPIAFNTLLKSFIDSL